MRLLENFSLAALLTAGIVSLSVESSACAKTGSIKIDGSSTVYPITEAIAELFQEEHPKVRVTIGVSGTGGGFKKFIAKETDINNASRSIKDKEKAKAAKVGLSYTPMPVAYDGISVVINKANTWAEEITMAQLKKLWEPGSTIKKWSDLDKAWPEKPIKLYGPGADSGTFDYFTKKVNGKSRASRSDYTASEDDNVIVTGVSGDKYALGYFGYAYYHENRSKLNAVALKKKDRFIAPTLDSIADSSYPLARPIFIYVSHEAVKRPELMTFVEFYMKNADKIARDVGYIPMSKVAYSKELSSFLSTVQPRG